MRIKCVIFALLIAAAVQAQNLIPYHPDNWSTPIVISTEPGTNTNNIVRQYNSTIYIDVAILNEDPNSPTYTNGQFINQVLIDDNIVWEFALPRLSALWWGWGEDMYVYNDLEPGLHFLELVIDVYNSVEETNEEDNHYYRILWVFKNGITEDATIGEEQW